MQSFSRPANTNALAQNADPLTPSSGSCQNHAKCQESVYIDSSKIELELQLVSTCEEQGNLHEALKHLQKMQCDYPESADVTFALGNLYSKMGYQSEAANCFREVLSISEECGAAHYNLGNALREQGRLEEALASFARAAELRPDLAATHYNLAQMLALFHRTEDAGLRYAAVIALEPEFQNAREHLREISCEMAGSALEDEIKVPPAPALILYQKALKLEEHEEWNAAEYYYRAAIELFPEFAEAHNNLGAVLLYRGDLQNAEASLHKAIELRAGYGFAHNNLGTVYQKQSRFEEALQSYRIATLLSPDSADAWLNLGVMQQQFGHIYEAETSYYCALKLAPNDEQAHNNLGSVLQRQERWAEAEHHHRLAISADPDSGPALKNLGIALQAQGRIAEANLFHQEASSLLPADLSIHYNLWNSWLLAGDFEKGWAKYDWWMQTGTYNYRAFSQPIWNGESAPNKTLLLYADHGFGDAIQFARYACLVKNQFQGKVILECQPELVELFRSLDGIDAVIAAKQNKSAPDILFDYRAGLMSLAYIMGTTIENIPAGIPYLKAEKQRVQDWSHKIASDGKLKVGIRWAGHPAHGNDKNRSCAFSQLLPILNVPNVHFYSLQTDVAAQELSKVQGDIAITDISNGFSSFAETAAAIEHLDLVISVDTSVAHLAAAMGKTVWLLLPFVPDWRWMMHRNDSPWYPNMLLFRQEQPKHWESALEGILIRLKQRAHENSKKL